MSAGVPHRTCSVRHGRGRPLWKLFDRVVLHGGADGICRVEWLGWHRLLSDQKATADGPQMERNGIGRDVHINSAVREPDADGSLEEHLREATVEVHHDTCGFAPGGSCLHRCRTYYAPRQRSRTRINRIRTDPTSGRGGFAHRRSRTRTARPRDLGHRWLERTIERGHAPTAERAHVGAHGYT